MKYFSQRTAKKGNTAGSPELPVVFKTASEQTVPTRGQWSYFSRLLSRTEKRTFFIAVVLFLVSVVGLGARQYDRATEVIPDFGGSYTEAIVGAPQYLNPLLAPLSDVDSDITSLVFSSLFRYNAKQELQQDLVTNYTVSEDNLTYTFQLRNDVKWHDGEPLTVDDVLFTILAIQDPLYQSPLADSLKGVEATRVDDQTISLKLSKPFAPFLTLLTFSILPQHLWFNVPPQNITLTELNIKPVGSGPFKFSKLTKNSDGNIKSLQLVANELYYSQLPYLNELNFVFYPDQQSALEGLKSKKAQGLSLVPAAEKEEVEKKNGDIAFYTLHIPQYTAVFFNQKQNKILQEFVIRRALAYGTDRADLITNALEGQGEELYSPILPWYTSAAPEAEVERYALNVVEANKLLEDAGWKYPENRTAEDGSFVPRQKDGTKIEFTLSTVDLPEYTQVAELLRAQWEKIGVKVTIAVYTREDIQTQVIRNRSYDALLFSEISAADPDPYAFWHASQQSYPGLGLSIFRNTTIDQVLAEGRRTANPEERKNKYVEFQKQFANDLPALMLYHPWYVYGVDEKIKGIPEHVYIPALSDRLEEGLVWYINSQRIWK